MSRNTFPEPQPDSASLQPLPKFRTLFAQEEIGPGAGAGDYRQDSGSGKEV